MAINYKTVIPGRMPMEKVHLNASHASNALFYHSRYTRFGRIELFAQEPNGEWTPVWAKEPGEEIASGGPWKDAMRAYELMAESAPKCPTCGQKTPNN